MTSPYLNFATALTSIPAVNKYPITPMTIELAILATALHYHAVFILDSYVVLSQKAGLTTEHAKDASDGKTTNGLVELDAAIYEFAKCVAQARGPVASEVWDRLKAILEDCRKG